MNLLELLEKSKPWEIFLKGTTINHPLFAFFTREDEGRLMKRVAVRGDIADRTMYFGWDDEYSYERVARVGNKYSDINFITQYLLNADFKKDKEFIRRYRR